MASYFRLDQSDNIQVQIEKLRNVNKLFQEYSDLMSKIGRELKNDT